MSLTLLNDVNVGVKKYWSNLFQPELLEMARLPAILNRDYEGDLQDEGNVVYVNQIQRPTAERKTVGEGHETFSVGKMQALQVAITADQVLTAGFKFDSLVKLQNQIGKKDSEIRKGIVEAMMIEVNNYLYSLISPSTSSPDHTITSVTDFNLSQLGAVRTLASKAKWAESDRYLLLNPDYYTDFLAVANLTGADYVGDDKPVIGGKVLAQRYGFWVLEDNSAGMSQISPTSATSDLGLAIHKDAIYLVMQQQPTFEISSLHSNEQHGYLITAKMVVGAKTGHDGSVKQITVVNA